MGDSKLFQFGERVTVVRAVDRHVRDLAPFIGERGKVTAVHWDAGGDGEHLFVVRLDGDHEEAFWADELAGDEEQFELFDETIDAYRRSTA